MFALIETKGATHIAIYVPHDSAAGSLPVLARMLEQNAKFVKIGWREIDMTTPEMSIILGDKYTVKDSEGVELMVAASSEVIGEDFTLATPAAFISNKKMIAKKDEEISRLRKELEFKGVELSELKERIAALSETED